MKTCSHCGHLFFDDDRSANGPAEELVDRFLDATESDRPSDLCPRCREELGMMNLMGFNL